MKKREVITIEGKVKEILFKKEKYHRNYVVLIFTLDNGITVKCNGFVPKIKEDDKVIIKGHFYEKVFYASNVDLFNPQILLNKFSEGGKK